MRNTVQWSTARRGAVQSGTGKTPVRTRIRTNYSEANGAEEAAEAKRRYARLGKWNAAQAALHIVRRAYNKLPNGKF
jgi:hypothetical protein